MEEIQLVREHAHLILTLDGERWLLDTGSPVSFGNRSELSFCGEVFPIPRAYMGMDMTTISDLIHLPCTGLLGVDILNRFDVVFDLPGNRMLMARDIPEFSGEKIPLELAMGAPVINVKIGQTAWRMAFDTGAQVSYFEDEAITKFPPAGRFVDFFPGIGSFTVDTYQVGLLVGTREYHLRCGSLPALLGMALSFLNVDGVLGNEICSTARIGYFPKRELLVIN